MEDMNDRRVLRCCRCEAPISLMMAKEYLCYVKLAATKQMQCIRTRPFKFARLQGHLLN